MTKSKPTVWARSNLRHIEATLVSQYGAQWRACFPPSVQEALIESRILALVMAQGLPQFAPAQELVRKINEAKETT